jgi:dTDP-4-dehydrorhamnose reductase
MKKVLIIGAKGMLGQELAKTFRKDKAYEITTWDREDLDIVNQGQVNKKITELKPDIIINSAAYNAVDKAEEKEEFEIAKKINGLAPGYLAKAAKKIGAIFVHYSTDYVFDGDLEKILEPEGCTHICATCSLHNDFVPQFGYNENAKTHPISNYGKSKLLGEKEIEKIKSKYYIIRLSKLFGKPGMGEGAKKSFFDVMLDLGKKHKEIKVVDEEISCFTYAPDLAKKTKEIIEAKKTPGIYHVTNSGACTWYEAVLELYKQAKIKTKVIPVSSSEFPRPAKRPAFSVLINTKLNPLRSYQLALMDYLRKLKK